MNLCTVGWDMYVHVQRVQGRLKTTLLIEKNVSQSWPFNIQTKRLRFNHNKHLAIIEKFSPPVSPHGAAWDEDTFWYLDSKLAI